MTRTDMDLPHVSAKLEGLCAEAEAVARSVEFDMRLEAARKYARRPAQDEILAPPPAPRRSIGLRGFE